ncbi:alpha,alpha-phosphotrehalase, partial [Anoxybacillus sp. LAT_38]|nr:alpha,alpha-phosphotrehalase [Anoxybacillus sp. LAT_38]
NALFWCNHDQPRAVSRFGNDREYHRESAKMLATTIHLMQGTPYIYPGEEILAILQQKSRDNGRTPMQWDDSPHAGFTTGTPWINVAPNYKEINVKRALEDEDSIFYHYKKLIQLRKAYDVIAYGD